MANRTLTRTLDWNADVDGQYSELRIERSAAGQPHLLFVITNYEDGVWQSESCAVVEDGNALLGPVLEWLGRGEA